MSEVFQTGNKEKEITRVVSELAKAVECLTQSIEATEARLTGVTRNTLPQAKEKAVESNIPYEVKLAQEINNTSDRILVLRDRLDDLLSRLEL